MDNVNKLVDRATSHYNPVNSRGRHLCWLDALGKRERASGRRSNNSYSTYLRFTQWPNWGAYKFNKGTLYGSPIIYVPSPSLDGIKSTSTLGTRWSAKRRYPSAEHRFNFIEISPLWLMPNYFFNRDKWRSEEAKSIRRKSKLNTLWLNCLEKLVHLQKDATFRIHLAEDTGANKRLFFSLPFAFQHHFF